MPKQIITPDRTLFFAGETVEFTLYMPSADIPPGRAVVRTNIGRAAVRRREIIDFYEKHKVPSGNDWHDIAMTEQPDAPGVFKARLPLAEVGVFEAKCCFIPDNGEAVIWPAGENFRIKTAPAANASGNGIYCAFVRQFGDNMMLEHSPEAADLSEYDRQNYIVVPPSGTFRKLTAQLDHIFGELNCRILQLLPVHPVPVAYGRMGRYGSPFAATDYFAVDPALAEFDRKASPMDQFIELIDAVHRYRGRIFMDIPVNHTGWASKLQCEHPEYFIKDSDGNFESPGAWGIVWADLCKLDYANPKVRELMAKVFLFWCRRGVDGFRCDAGYMLPESAWDYIIAKVRSEYPDTVFLLEGLGGPLPVQEKLLSQCGLDWGYSELFQNYTRDDISRYYTYMNSAGNRYGTLANFAETHDNDRLASHGREFAKLRFLVTALLSQHGTFGFANGAEFFAAEKIDVHGCGALNFANQDNLNKLTGKLNTLLSSHPAFGIGVDVKLIQHGPGNVIAAMRSKPDIPKLLILINLDCAHPSQVNFPATGHHGGTDLLTGTFISFGSGDNGQYCFLPPGEARCISFDGFKLPQTPEAGTLPEAIRLQRGAAMAQRTALKLYGMEAASRADVRKLLADPESFMASLAGTPDELPPLTIWEFPVDCRREVMAAPGDALLIKNDTPFIADLIKDGETTLFHAASLPVDNGDYEFVLLPLPVNKSDLCKELQLEITASADGKSLHKSGKIILLPHANKRKIQLSGSWDKASRHYVFGSNCYGGYSLFSADWGKLYSKYEAILSANISRQYPVDRHVLFTQCRAWLVIDDYSHELTSAALETYTANPGNRAKWHFKFPDGHGGNSALDVEFKMAENSDAVELRFSRIGDTSSRPAAGKLILRPDIEDRVNHATTRACDGAELHFRNSIKVFPDGFDFQPADHCLSIRLEGGEFHSAPEWQYMVDLPLERKYGLPDKTDLFSPGYFTADLAAGAAVTLSAVAGTPPAEIIYPALNLPETLPAAALAVDALRRFTVKRDDLTTVIAGYPWFLDWGRDTLIALRGLTVFPEFHQLSKDILRRFAAFEKAGTIPNMICGGNDSNRDTSDAPLYLIVAVKEYIAATNDKEFLNSDCDGRKLENILHSIVDNYISGTPNGIRMDKESKLIFSPSHFSWMDTNYPAGTPREGYPVEIQSLWYAALDFLGFKEMATEVSESIEKWFFPGKTISDCLHCPPGTPAREAVPDDHIRCNMLMAITSGAVKSPDIKKRILKQGAKLLIPGAIRTLADQTYRYQLPVYHHGILLNDPARPYQGHYQGPEDTCRKMAYHNGTAWCWPFPSYCEALAENGSETSRRRALALLLSCARWFENGVIGELPEVLDGDAPHTNGGCPAQAWSVSEFFRVLKKLSAK